VTVPDEDNAKVEMRWRCGLRQPTAVLKRCGG